MKYHFCIKRTEIGGKSGQIYLNLGVVGSIAELEINGQNLGIKVSSPYRFNITEALKDGENEFTVTVSNTLAHAVKDVFSRYLQYKPSGLNEQMKLEYSE